jgi:NAD(P)-dependent dehydrogenase (short-subunit alcohol dehydrogenase family)
MACLDSRLACFESVTPCFSIYVPATTRWSIMKRTFTHHDIPDQNGKTFFITGANTGIGFEAAVAFAGKGARVLLGCRNPERGNDAVARIRETVPQADVSVVRIDLADLDSIREAAAVVNQEPQLDVLINNAGIMWNPKTMTKDGFESQFGINHLGHFALTGLLLMKLEETPGSRIVTISSGAHKMGNGDLPWDDIHAEKDYNSVQRYNASKLANLIFTHELDRRLRARGSDTVAVAAHPGGANTDLFRHVQGFMYVVLWLLQPLTWLLMNSPKQGAWPTEFAATGPQVQGGQYFGPSRFGEISGPARRVDSSSQSKDPAKGKRLWELSIELTGVNPAI